MAVPPPWALSLLQHRLLPDKWKMLVCCMLLNQTTRAQVDKVRDTLFSLYSTPHLMSMADPENVARIIQPCGFQNRRARAIIRMSDEYKRGKWSHPRELYGVGKYACDSWDMFVLGKYDVKPTDKKLLAFINSLNTEDLCDGEGHEQEDDRRDDLLPRGAA